MDKGKINLLLDALMFLCITVIAGIGLLMRFVLIPGKERQAEYGRNVELLLFGMDRHEWGTVHFIIAVTFFGLLAIHVVLHWSLILALFGRLIEGTKTRFAVAAVFIAVSTAFLSFSLFLKPEVRERPRGRHHIDKEPKGPAEPSDALRAETPAACRGDKCHPLHGDVRGMNAAPHPIKKPSLR